MLLYSLPIHYACFTYALELPFVIRNLGTQLELFKLTFLSRRIELECFKFNVYTYRQFYLRDGQYRVSE